MSQIVLQARKREPGTKIAKALRSENFVPGVYYTAGEEAIHFSVKRTDLRPIVRSSEAKLVSLQVDGIEPKLCIMKQVDFDPLTDLIIHFDLLGVSAGHKITVEIPLHLVGNSVGVREGGVLEQTMLRAHVLVDPTTMPEHIDVNIEELGVNSSIHIGDLNVPGIEFTDRPEAVIVTCAPPKVSDDTEDTGEPAAATAEAEVSDESSEESAE